MNRIAKTRKTERKVLSERILASYIINFGTTPTMPCANCFRHQRKCQMAEGSSRYSECLTRKVSYDGADVSYRQRKKMESEEQQLLERLLFLKKQQKILRDYGEALFRRNIQDFKEAHPDAPKATTSIPNPEPPSNGAPELEFD
ncbi:hypothetical protein B0T19DRAFT_433681 [Cercophora scortea]|uniref:Uncharacterized protein n=1 Tax=Cercophora scortea TaxID=314031 RepID=A0AAE0I7P0_9PEZI|nr:hypothetical protein B0T19DRAFT_433681 [Cercophora scortea]